MYRRIGVITVVAARDGVAIPAVAVHRALHEAVDVVIGLAEKFSIPVHAVGVGEGIDDLRPFEARAFARALMGLPAA